MTTERTKRILKEKDTERKGAERKKKKKQDYLIIHRDPWTSGEIASSYVVTKGRIEKR